MHPSSGSSDRRCCHVQVSTALGAVLREEGARERPCGVFGSFGWSGEAVDELQSRLKVGTWQWQSKRKLEPIMDADRDSTVLYLGGLVSQRAARCVAPISSTQREACSPVVGRQG